MGWLFVGVGLSLVTIGLVSLLRTRWRYVKAWKKCALLSFWVHVLLAYVATVIQVASAGLGMGPGEGPGPPIEVALVTTEITPLEEVSSLVIEQTVEETAEEAESEGREEANPVESEPAAEDEAVSEPPSEAPAPLEAPELLAARRNHLMS